jgi:hypothetical protein
MTPGKAAQIMSALPPGAEVVEIHVDILGEEFVYDINGVNEFATEDGEDEEEVKEQPALEEAWRTLKTKNQSQG